MAADGSIIIDTKLNTKGFDVLGKSASGLQSILRKVGAAIGTAFAVGKLTEFAKEAIELGSNLAEVQNIVDVTFTTLNENINEFAKNALFASGLSETMAKKYAGTFGAMANSLGFTEEEAYTLSTTLTTLSGDIASFYNITQEEAFTKLTSVFTGETEAIKHLGVVMTETALNAYSMEKGFGRTIAQMSEQEKVALRYRFVLDQLSNVSGDFARTSDSWANQTRILSVQFEQLKATIGQGLINALTPVIKVINTIIAGLQVVANTFAQFTALLFGSASKESAGSTSKALKDVSDGYGEAADGANKLAKGTAAAAKEAKKAIAPFDELTTLTTQDSASGVRGIGTGLNGTGLLGDLDTITVDAKMQDEISPKIQAIVDKIHKLIDPLKEIDLTPLKDSLFGLGDSLSSLGSVILDNLEWAWFNILVPLSKWTLEEATPAVLNLLADGFRLAASFIEPFAKGIRTIWDYMKPLFSWIGDTALKIIERLGQYWQDVTDVFTEKAPEIQGVLTGIAEFFSMFWYTVEPVLNLLRDVVLTVFDNILSKTSEAISALIDIVYGLVEFIVGFASGDWERAWDAIPKVLEGIWDYIVAIIENIWLEIETLFTGFVNALEEFVNYVNLIIEGLIEAADFLKKVFSPVSGNSTTGSPAAGASVASAYSVNPGVPQLAKGAVLPANQPFLAVVGDQKHGTNVEAPLETIKQALSEVMMQNGFDVNIEFTGSLSELARILSPAISKEQRNASRARGT